MEIEIGIQWIIHATSPWAVSGNFASPALDDALSVLNHIGVDAVPAQNSIPDGDARLNQARIGRWHPTTPASDLTLGSLKRIATLALDAEPRGLGLIDRTGARLTTLKEI